VRHSQTASLRVVSVLAFAAGVGISCAGPKRPSRATTQKPAPPVVPATPPAPVAPPAEPKASALPDPDPVWRPGMVEPPERPTLASADATGRTWVVNTAHASALDEGEGTAAAPFRTINAAAGRAQPGDRVLVHAGTYREHVRPARGGKPGRPVVYEAAPGERVIVSGADEWRPAWRRVDGMTDVWAAKLDPALFDEDNPFHRTISINGKDVSKAARPVEPVAPRVQAAETSEKDREKRESLPETLGEVFLDGERVAQATSLPRFTASERAWMVDPAGARIQLKLSAGDRPQRHRIEITTRAQVFAPARRGLGYITVRGFVFEKSANQGPFPQRGMVSVRSGHHWVIENCTIRQAKTIGLGCGSEHWDGKLIANTVAADQRLILGGHHLIRNNHVVDNGLCGIAGWNHRGTQILDNTVERNNCLHFPHTGGWEEWAGIKLHCSDAVIRGNLVRDNHAAGIWIDNIHGNAVIDGNVLLRNRRAGVMLELNRTPGRPGRVINNVIAGSHGKGFYAGYGIYAHDASDIVASGNLVFDCASYAVLMRTITNRKSGSAVVETSRVSITGNAFLHNGGRISIPFAGPRSKDVDIQANTYSSDTGDAARFALNAYAEGIKKRTRADELRRRIEEAKVDAGPLSDPDAWAKSPTLTLALWRHLRGYDRDGRVVDVGARVSDAPDGTVTVVLTRPGEDGGPRFESTYELEVGATR